MIGSGIDALAYRWVQIDVFICIYIYIYTYIYICVHKGTEHLYNYKGQRKCSKKQGLFPREPPLVGQ